MKDVCKFHAGGDVPKENFSRFPTDDFQVPVYSNGIDERALYGYTNRPQITEACVSISARGTIGAVMLHTVPFYPAIRLITAIPVDGIDVRYLYYALQVLNFRVPTSGIPQLTIPMVSKYKISAPPLSEQRRIVSILDHFDTLTHDLASGLPAEIAAREKQYAYYRDKLLSFPRKET